MLLYANDLQVGDMVLKYDRRRDTRMGDKMKPAYTGPYIIADILGRGSYRLRHAGVDGKELKQTAKSRDLKKYHVPTSPSKRRTSECGTTQADNMSTPPGTRPDAAPKAAPR